LFSDAYWSMLILPCCSVLSDGVCLSELKGLLTYLLTYLLTFLTVIMTLKSAPASFAWRRHLNQYTVNNNNNNEQQTEARCISVDYEKSSQTVAARRALILGLEFLTSDEVWDRRS